MLDFSINCLFKIIIMGKTHKNLTSSAAMGPLNHKSYWDPLFF